MNNNYKPFNADTYNGEPLATRSGCAAKLLCTDADNSAPVIALITSQEGRKEAIAFKKNGKYFFDDHDSQYDLFTTGPAPAKDNNSTLEKICGIMGVTADFMNSNQSDALAVLPAIHSDMCQGKESIIIVNQNGCSRVERFINLLIVQNKPATLESAVEYCKKQGASFAMKLTGKMLYIQNFKVRPAVFQQLAERFSDYIFVKETDNIAQ